MRLLAPLVLLVAGFAGADAMAKSAVHDETTSIAFSCSEDLSDVADAPLDPSDADRLFIRLSHAAERGCGARLAEWLASSSCASNTTGVVAGALFSSAAHRPDWMNAVLERALDRADGGDVACAHQLLPAVQQATSIDDKTRALLDRAIRSSDPDITEAGWLVLGTAETIARARGNPLADSIDAEIAAALSNASDSDRVTLLEAAGNAGCRACMHAITAAAQDPDPWVRRTAVGAFRFLPDGARGMCAGLSDPSGTVRDQARWAVALTSTECGR